MNLRIRWAFAAAALCLGLAAPVLAQPPEQLLPDGPGRDVVIRVCTGCHEATQFAFARLTPEEWESEVSKMESAGAEMTGEEEAAIIAYLAKTLPKVPPPPATPGDAKAPSGR